MYVTSKPMKLNIIMYKNNNINNISLCNIIKVQIYKYCNFKLTTLL